MTPSAESLSMNRAWLSGYVEALRYLHHALGDRDPVGQCGMTLDEAIDELAALDPPPAARPRKVVA